MTKYIVSVAIEVGGHIEIDAINAREAETIVNEMLIDDENNVLNNSTFRVTYRECEVIDSKESN